MEPQDYQQPFNADGSVDNVCLLKYTRPGGSTLFLGYEIGENWPDPGGGFQPSGQSHIVRRVDWEQRGAWIRTMMETLGQ